MMTSKRGIEFAWLTFAGIPGDIWCGMKHICMDGHLYHKEMPKWWLYADFIWVAVFVAAAIAVLRSDMSHRFIPFSLLLFLVLSRMLLASGGGVLILLEFPMMLYLAILAIWTILRFRRLKRQQKMEPQLK